MYYLEYGGTVVNISTNGHSLSAATQFVRYSSLFWNNISLIHKNVAESSDLFEFNWNCCVCWLLQLSGYRVEATFSNTRHWTARFSVTWHTAVSPQRTSHGNEKLLFGLCYCPCWRHRLAYYAERAHCYDKNLFRLQGWEWRRETCGHLRTVQQTTVFVVFVG
jgi:hypothetical protein